MRAVLSAFCERHPLVAAAMVAVSCVVGAEWVDWWSVVLALFGAGIGWYLRNGRVALGYLLVGVLAVSVFITRTTSRDRMERDLLSSPSCELRARTTKDAKGGGGFWTAPAVVVGENHKGAKVWWEGRGEPPIKGAEVTGIGSFFPLREPRNPGDFDLKKWLRNQGIAVIFRAHLADATVETGRLARWGKQLRAGFRAGVIAGLEQTSREAMVILAIVIGEQPPDAEELVAVFRNSGTLHAFSVSGLHVGMVGMIGWFVLCRLGVPRRWAIGLLLPLIFGYSWITGNSAPAVRSAWMAAVFLGAFIFQRKPDLLNALGAVLLMAMLWDGRLLFSPGVQLSYFVVAAIAFGARLAAGWFAWMAKTELYLPMGMMNRWQGLWLRFRQKVAQSFGASIAAAVGSTPLTAFHFGLITPVSILAGVVLVPIVFALLALSLVSAAVHPLIPRAAEELNGMNAYLAKACVFTAQTFASVPGGHYQLPQEDRPFLLVYDLERGAGASCFSGGKTGTVLIDCANRYNFQRSVAPSLRRLGVQPDSVVLTHPDGGHLGGASAVWEAFPIKQVLLPVEKSRSPNFRAWVDDAPSAGVKLVIAKETKSFPMPDGASLEVIAAPDPLLQNARADDRVAIYRLHWRGWKLLFTSDSGLGTEMGLLDQQRDLTADVIIAGRHREDLSLGDGFLDAVNPQAIIASHSDFPYSERLDAKTVTYWRSRGIGVVHQGESGGVTLRIDDEGNLQIAGFVDRSVLTLKRR